MAKLKIKKTLALTNFVQQTVQKAVVQTKETLLDWESHKLNPELLRAIMEFVELEIRGSKYRGQDIDRTALVKEIFTQLFGELADTEVTAIESGIQFVIDHSMLKKGSLCGKILSSIALVASFLK